MTKQLGKWFPVFVLPTLIAFLIAFLIPFILGVGLSFTSFTTISDATFNGLANYKAVFAKTVTSCVRYGLR